MSSDNPEWDLAFARDCVGKTVLIGLTYCAPSGEIRRRTELFGTIEEADPKGGFRINLAGAHAGEDYSLPPETRAFQPAEPGVYKLHSTGEEIEDPDLLCIWTVTEAE